MRIVKFSEQDAKEFYSPNISSPSFPELVKHITSDLIVGIEIVGLNAIEKLQTLIGPSNPIEAKKVNPKSLRALYGADEIKNAIHSSESSLVK